MPRSHSKSEPVALDNELKSLYEISDVIQCSEPTTESLEEIMKSIGKLVDFRSASLFIISGQSGRLEEVCTIGRTVDLINFVNFDMGAGISAWVAQKKRPIILNNLRKSQGGTHTKSFLSVPVIFAEKVRGVINLAHDEAEAFTQRDAEIIGVVASMLSLIVERIEYVRLERALNDKIENLSEKLENSREKLGQIENVRTTDDTSVPLAERIYNPLAIIAGNAQFLLMTMKNPGASVLKRLKTIDSEASNLMNIAGKLQSRGDSNRIESMLAAGGNIGGRY